MSQNRRRAKPGEARAWFEDVLARINAGEFTEDCVLWPFGTNSRGYPAIAIDGTSMQVTRLIVERFIGASLLATELVCHTCDTPRCINIQHLYRGDNADNTADKITRGRHARGETSGRAKLTAKDVREMRATFTGRYGETIALARRYGVDVHTIKDAVFGSTWREVN